jgi:5-formyltetrahydrofolate cyclo-ligase
MDGSAAKKALRTAAEAARRILSEASPDAGAAIAEHFLGAALGRPGQAVAGYMPTRNEADPGPLISTLRARGCRILLPRVAGKDVALAFHRWDEGEAPVTGAYRLLEAAPDWPAAVPDLVLVPLLAFDAEGHRLGYGGGYYDRTLKGLRANGAVLAVGIGFAGQEVPELPRGAGDERLDWIVTEKEARKFG